MTKSVTNEIADRITCTDDEGNEHVVEVWHRIVQQTFVGGEPPARGIAETRFLLEDSGVRVASLDEDRKRFRLVNGKIIQAKS